MSAATPRPMAAGPAGGRCCAPTHSTCCRTSHRTRLLDLGLRQAIDLRWPSELASAPSVFRDSPRVRYRSIPLLAFEEDDPTPHLGLVGMYRRILDERGAHLVEVVRAVIEPEGMPVAIGCAAGKDRTGVAIAIILAALGVPRELVVADYAMSAGFFAGPVDDPHLVDWRGGPVETESPPGVHGGGPAAPR